MARSFEQRLFRMSKRRRKIAIRKYLQAMPVAKRVDFESIRIDENGDIHVDVDVECFAPVEHVVVNWIIGDMHGRQDKH